MTSKGSTQTSNRGMIFTLKTGNPNWMKITFPTIQKYCEKHGIPLDVTTDEDVKDITYPSKFRVREWIDKFLETDFDWFCYVDADVYIEEKAPNIFDQGWEPGIYARYDISPGYIRTFPTWFKRHFGEGLPEGYIYRNAGVYLMDRQTAREFRKLILPPFINCVQEQHQINAWWGMMGNKLKVLPNDWNAAGSSLSELGWFRHYMGKRKMEKIGAHRPFRGKLVPGDNAPKTEYTPTACSSNSKTRVIAIPLKRGAFGWKDGTCEEKELLYLLRSIQRYWKDKSIDVVLLSAGRPTWASDDLHFRRCVTYQEALQCIPTLADEVVWFNDDTFLLKDTDWKDLYPVRRHGVISPKQAEVLMKSPNAWRRRLGKVTKDLYGMGIDPVYKFSTHTPYPYEKDLIIDTLSRFELEYKTPIETAHFNFHRVEHQNCGDKITRYSNKAIPWHQDEGPYRFLNFNDAGLGLWMKGFIRGKFDEPSRFET